MISHIIPCMNLYEITAGLLDSLFQHTHESYLGEIILIDNGSWDETAGIYNEFDISVYLRNEENVGFPRAVNQGILLAKEDLICVWNNDTVVSPGWIQALLAHIDKPGYGMLSGFVYEPDVMDLNTFQLTVSSKTTQEIKDFAKGAPWLFKREVFDTIGLFDERFFPTQCEDSDFLLRMSLAKIKHGMATGCKVFHHSGVTQTKELLPKYGSFCYAADNRKKFEEKWGTMHIDLEKAYETGEYYGKPR